MKPQPKNDLLNAAFGCFKVPARLAFSGKYQSLSAVQFKHFFNLLCLIHLQGGVLVNLHQARVALEMYQERFKTFIESMIAREFLKETDAGYVPFDEELFLPYVPPAQKYQRRKDALWREKEAQRHRTKTRPEEPIAMRKAREVLLFLMKVNGRNYPLNIDGQPSEAVRRIADRIATGTKVIDLKAKISAVAQSCRSMQERKERLKPSMLF